MFGHKKVAKESEEQKWLPPVEVNPQTLMRWFSYDFADGEAGITKMLQLIPVSDEGHVEEMRQSAERTACVAGLQPLFGLFAQFLGPVMTMLTFHGLSTYKTQNDGNLTEEQVGLVCSSMNQSMLFHMFISVMSAANELGLIGNVGRVELDYGEVDK